VNRWLLFVVLAFGVAAFGEDRFGRPVLKLANPESYQYFKLDDNNFPFLNKNGVTVSCMTYRGTKRYYVEVGVSNQLTQSIVVSPNFVSFLKPGYTIIAVSTFGSAADLSASVAGPFVRTPPPPPTSATTVYSGNATTYGNMTQVNGTATTTVDNSAAGWHELGQAIGQRRYYKIKGREQSFANYLQMFAHERQDVVVQPGKANVYVYTFEQVKHKKAPFTVNVQVGVEKFEFAYKE
jgi:hypothetical protein